jgi:hypothetical protein
MMSLALKAVRLKGRIRSDRQLELIDTPPDLPEGEVELILLYERKPLKSVPALSPLLWPVLDGGTYTGGNLSREKIYDDDGR